MQTAIRLASFALFGCVVLPLAGARAQTQTNSPYPVAAPISQYRMPSRDAEIALARTAAPSSISGKAEVLVLGKDGYITAVPGTNGFVCFVARAWAAATNDPGFWNPRNRSPICVNPAAASTYLPAIRLKAKLVLSGHSKAEIASALASAYQQHQLPLPAPGAMCFMMSKQQYLSDEGKNWHPHMMWFVPGDAAKSWGADLPGSPVMAADDPEDHMTIFLVGVSHWSDGTPASSELH